MSESLDQIEHAFQRTQETENYQPDTTTQSMWNVVRAECVAGELLAPPCEIFKASADGGRIRIVAQRLACGCILIPDDSEEVGL